MARETASMSALTKFSVTGVPRAREVGTASSTLAVASDAAAAALRGAAWAMGAIEFASRAIAIVVAFRRRRVADSRSMITRSRCRTSHRCDVR